MDTYYFLENNKMNKIVRRFILEEKFYTCKSDRAFKEVFMNKDNKDLLICLLEEVLDLKIKELEYLNLERNVGSIHIKRSQENL